MENIRRDISILNYVEHVPILASLVTGCVRISAFALLVSAPVGMTSCATTAGIKRYKSILKKKRRRMMKQYC